MSRIRKDTKGKVLHKGEDYKKDKKLYRYSYTDSLVQYLFNSSTIFKICATMSL